MRSGCSRFSLFCGVLLIGNFVAMNVYADAIKSTYAFIARGTVFYPLAWLDLFVGIALIVITVRNAGRRKSKEQ